MANMGEYGSLLQLGFGIGAGLSVFRAPMEIRAKKIKTTIDNELALIKGGRTEKTKKKECDLSSIELEFHSTTISLGAEYAPYMYITALFALANWIALIYASSNAEKRIGTYEELIIIFISVASYVIIGGILEFKARKAYNSIYSQLEPLTRIG